MAKFRFRRGVNIGSIVKKLVSVIITLYVGGTIVTELGNVMLNTTSPFYKGLTLIGWTVGSNANCYGYTGTTETCINATGGSGILAVVGILGIASIVLEFVNFTL